MATFETRQNFKLMHLNFFRAPYGRPYLDNKNNKQTMWVKQPWIIQHIVLDTRDLELDTVSGLLATVNKVHCNIELLEIKEIDGESDWTRLQNYFECHRKD